jgi:hypothetical protein
VRRKRKVQWTFRQPNGWLGFSRAKIESVAEMDTTLAPELKAGR